MNCMSCIESIARLHLYLDRELSNEEVTIVQQHLSDCPNCECRFHFDLELKRLIHERCTIERAPAHLREAVLRLARLPAGQIINLDPELEMEIRADLEGWE
jgi:mycothiol system anti-sigma-R factor